MADRVFISYAHKDGVELANRLFVDLSARGYDTWLDRNRLKGGSNWSREIEDNLNHAEIVLALLSAGSFESDVCRGEQLRSLRRNKCVIPLLVQSDADRPVYLEIKQYLDFSDPGNYSLRLQDLVATIRSHTGASLAPRFRTTRYNTVPPLPLNFVPRPAELESLRQTLLNDNDRRHVALVALRGMGGIGKTVLAQALCRDDTIQAAFPDGVVWIKVGDKPTDFQLIDQMHEAARAIGGSTEGFDSLERSANLLRSLLKHKMVLLVLDDVWDPAPVYHFQPSDEARFCRILFTTRNDEISASVGAQSQPLNILDDRQSRRMLARYAALKEDLLPPAATGILSQCHGLPLALAMIGALLRNKSSQRWADVLDSLQNADLDEIRLTFPNYSYPSLVAAIEISINNLEEEERRLYLSFAVFPYHTAIPEAALETAWAIDGKKVRRTADKFVDRSLVMRDDAGRITLHDLLLAYVRKSSGSLTEMHSRLVERYQQRCSDGWHTGPADGYFLEHLAYHLKEAGLEEELRSVLLDYSWLKKKLVILGVPALINDFDIALNTVGANALDSIPESSNQKIFLLVRDALRLSAHVLSTDISQLSSQLCGRLSPQMNPAIENLLQQARQSNISAVLPITATLTTPGGALLLTLAYRSGYVNALTVTSDGGLAIVASDDEVPEIREIATGRKLRNLKGHSEPVAALALTLDGNLIVTGSYDHTLKIWKLDTGSELHTLKGHLNVVNGVVMTSCGNYVLSASGDTTLKLWELNTGRCLRSFEGHSGPVYAVAVTPDGQLAVSASMDRTLKIWEVASGRELRTLAGHTDWVRAVAVTPDGKLAVSASNDHTLKVWEIASGRELLTMVGHTDWVRAVAVTPDGELAVSASEDQTSVIWEIATGSELQRLIGHSDRVTAVALTADGTFAVSGSWDQSVKVWSTDRPRVLPRQIGHSGYVKSVVVARGRRVAVSAGDDHILKVWELETGRELGRLVGHSDSIYALAVTADGGIALSASHAMIKVWDLSDRRELHTFSGLAPITALSVTSDGAHIVTASSSTLTVWSATGEQLRYLKHGDVITACEVTPEGKLIVSASDDQTLRVWDLVSGRELRRLRYSGSVTALAVTPDGKLAIFGFNDHTLKVWELSRGRELRTMPGHKAPVLAVTTTPDSKLVISGSADGELKVWDLATGREVRSMENHLDGVAALSVMNHGQLVSSVFGRTVKLWEVYSGLERGVFTADVSLTCCSASSDGTVLVVGDGGGGVHFLIAE